MVAVTVLDDEGLVWYQSTWYDIQQIESLCECRTGEKKKLITKLGVIVCIENTNN